MATHTFSEAHSYGGSRRQPLDLHTLWRLLEQMDKEARRNGLIGGGSGTKNVGINSIDGDDIPSVDDIGDQKSDDAMSEHGKMSTWGNMFILFTITSTTSI